MKSLMLLLLCGVLAMPSVGGPDAVDQTLPAQAGIDGESHDRVDGELLAVLRNLTPEEALSRGTQWEIPGAAVSCVGAAGEHPEETVLTCQWGQGYNALFDGRALLWRENGAWVSQPYPLEAVRGVGYFQRLYRQGSDLIVVMNVSEGMTAETEQVQVLHLDGTQWRTAWLPQLETWTTGHASVTFVDSSLDRFIVETDSYGLSDQEGSLFAESNAGDHRLFREEWVRDQQGYIRASRTETPTEYGAVVHFVTALANGDDAEARRWAVYPELVDRAKQSGLLEAAAKGFFTRREGSTAEGWGPTGPTFRLITNIEEEQPQWLVQVQQVGDRWLVSEIATSRIPH